MKKLTAAELIEQLNADPDFAARRAREDGERQRCAEEWRRAESPLVDELQASGVAVESAWDLVNTSASYSTALPILLKHLERPYPAAIREGIARALAVPEAAFGFVALQRLYRQESEERVKSGLAAAIAATVNDETIDALIALAKDASHGSSRLLLLSALARSIDPRARAALVELGTDPDLHKEVGVVLRRLKPVKP